MAEVGPQFVKSILKGGGAYRLYKMAKMRPGARMVGEDVYGNTYWEDESGSHPLANRWIEYSDFYEDGSQVPPEWHGWLHRITDANPITDPELFAVPDKFKKGHKPNKTGTSESYRPPGHFARGKEKRNFSLDNNIEEWTPEN